MGSVFFVVGPVRGENLVGPAAEQKVEFLLEDAVELFAELLIEIGHRPAAELEALGRILGRPAGRLHDAIDGNLSADDNLPHGSLSLFESRTNRPPYVNVSRNCRGLTIRIPRNGSSGRRCALSPVTRKFASPQSAHSRIKLSAGSLATASITIA